MKAIQTALLTYNINRINNGKIIFKAKSSKYRSLELHIDYYDIINYPTELHKQFWDRVKFNLAVLDNYENEGDIIITKLEVKDMPVCNKVYLAVNLALEKIDYSERDSRWENGV
jgi:hypothetical protein